LKAMGLQKLIGTSSRRYLKISLARLLMKVEITADQKRETTMGIGM